MTQEASSLDESLEDLYEDAPCGYISLLPGGEIIGVNRTLLSWTGYSAEELLSGKRFAELLTAPGALLYETYGAPLLRLRGSIGEIALDLLCCDGTPLPVLFSGAAKRDSSGALCLFRIVILHAPRRREYERELLLARTQAEEAAEQLSVQREAAERKVVEQDRLLQAIGRMAAGDLETPVVIEPDSPLSSMARGLDRMREDVLGQVREMKERNAEILRLNAELRHQIEQRSRLLVESMQSAMDGSPVSEMLDGSAEALPILPSGTLLARRYRVEEILGQGAMGTVYEVERTSDGRRFAAKVLNVNPDYTTMARLAREAQLLARLQHPNLIAIVDVDITLDRLAYLVTELVHGKTLAELGGRYGDRDFILPVLLQIADALTTVHSAGVVHRDLKPANVLVSLSEDGVKATAKLADFGISRLLDIDQAALDEATSLHVEAHVEPYRKRSGTLMEISDDPARRVTTVTAVSAMSGFDATLETPAQRAGIALPADGLPAAPPARRSTAPDGTNRRSRPPEQLTQAGTLVGTLHYMAPELRGGANLAEPSSDIFSFGIMAYEVLAGALPFDKPPVFLAGLGRDTLRFKPLDAMCRGLTPALSRLLERCLAIDPAARPTALELSAALGESHPPH